MLPQFLAFLLLASSVKAAVYDVGPSHQYLTIGSVPALNSLQAGDKIRIHAKPTPYFEKFVIDAEGSAEFPIVFEGVPDGNGNLPIIDGENAVAPLSQDYWNEVRNLIKVGGSSVPSTPTGPRHIRIQGLHLRNAHSGFSFTTDNGGSGSYSLNAACVHVEQGSFIELVNNEITGCGNGIFIAGDVTQVLIEGNYIHGNGNINRFYEHNTYTEALGIVYRFNHFGPLCAGCTGNNLKDRSGGLEVAYNYIEGGNRQLDLVDSGDSTIINDPAYSTTLVYGNILVEPDGAGNRQIVHYGGDSGTLSNYRQGTMQFYHNTIISTRVGRSTFVRLSSDAETCDARNNIIFVTDSGNELELLAEDRGTLVMESNWIKTGYILSFGNPQTSRVTELNTVSSGTDPGFISVASEDFHLTGSLLPSAALAAGVPSVTQEYVEHRSSAARSSTDLGAFGYTTTAPTCGDNAIGGSELCDGTALGGEDCLSQGFSGGTLACNGGCSAFDSSNCYYCGDGVINGSELCDGTALGGENCQSQGFDGGSLACTGDCSAFDASSCYGCGDNVITNGAEVCDGTALGGENCQSQGFDGGSLACTGDCSGFDTSSCHSCGDSVINGAEVCDGTDLGGLDCQSQGFAGGTLGCTASCSFDYSGCTHSVAASMESKVVSGIGYASWTQVVLENAYMVPVPVCSVQYPGTTNPTVVRMQNIGPSSFEILLQDVGDGSSSLTPMTVHCVVVEEGAWTMPDGRLIEAQSYTSTVTDRKTSFVGEVQAYVNSYTQPVVLGQVMSYNDVAWSVFWSSSGARRNPPSATSISTGKHVAEDSETTRADETVGFIVMEAGHGSGYEAGLGSDTVRGYQNNPSGYAYSYANAAFDSSPEVTVVAQAAMDGGDGGWAVVAPPISQSASTLGVLIDEDQIGGQERSHTTEQVAYIVFEFEGSVGGLV